MLSDDAQQEWAALLASYHAQLPDLAAELAGLWSQAKGAPDVADHIAAISAWAHKLAGSAGFCGYGELHDAALKLEMRICGGQTAGGVFGPQDIEAEIEALSALIKRLAAAPPPAASAL